MIDWQELALQELTGKELAKFTDLRAEASEQLARARATANAAVEEANRELDETRARVRSTLRRAAMVALRNVIDQEVNDNA